MVTGRKCTPMTTVRFSHRRLGQTAARALSRALALAALLGSPSVNAQAAPPAGRDDAAFDLMNVLARRGLHDIDDERWNLYGQLTYISNWKRPFHARYTNVNGSPHSLAPDAERSFTGSFTLFFGLKLWHGGEAYVVPEVIAERPLSGLHGIGGAIQNFELQKGGSETPQLYRARTYLRQTFGLGGPRIAKVSDPMQLAAVVEARRLVVTAGSFSVLDVFDRSAVTGDPRRTFFNMAFMTHAAWDFPADARGYTWGAAVELDWDDWAWRAGRFTPPEHPNQLAIEARIWKYYGDAIEVEHDHRIFDLPGAVRILGYRNHVIAGDFEEAVAALQADGDKNAAACTGFHYDSTNAAAPDLCWVRRANTKLGVGISVDQTIAKDVGIFFRAMYSDGKTEVDAYNSADRSISFGAVARGWAWQRPSDITGAAVGASWISAGHARYLEMGGVDGFLGDGALRRTAEEVVEIFYSAKLLSTFWLAVDYQLLWNPGYNVDRAGPVRIPGAKFHAEF